MALTWIHESAPRWDRGKAAILGSAPAGALPVAPRGEGELLPDDWFRVEEDGAILGYGWMDASWGEAQVLLAVARAAEGRGVGSFILENLAREAHARGFRYVYNVVPESHPRADAVRAWLLARGFRASEDGRELRRSVRPPA